MISTSEQNYHTLLTDRNLLTMVQESQPYVLSILSHSVPKVLVPDEHHILKDLPFYKVARTANPKAY